MILPGPNNYIGYIGSTFDTVITIYPAVDDIYNWRGSWALGVNYALNDVVIGLDNNAYLGLIANISINPVGNPGTWQLLPPMDLTGYSANFVIGTRSNPILTLTPGNGVTMGDVAGTVSIKMTTVQTAAMLPTSTHYFVQVTDPSSNVYYYMNGSITWSNA